MAHTIWSGAISFGLVNVPIRIVKAVNPQTVSFRQLRKGDQCPVRYKKVCRNDEAEIPASDIVRGYEVAKNQFVIVDDDELKGIEPAKQETIDINEFVDVGEIDPVFFENTYFLVPDRKAGRAYFLLQKALEKTGRAGVAKFVMHRKEHLVLVRAREGVLMLSVLHFADEVLSPASLDEEFPAEREVSERDLAMARQLVEALASAWKPEKYHNEYIRQVEALVQAKAAGAEIVTPPEAEAPSRVLDLTAALRESLEKARKAAPAEEEAEAEAPKKRRRKSA